MNKNLLSLRLSLIGSFLTLIVILVVGFSFVSANFFVRGMDAIVSARLDLAGLTYLQASAQSAQPSAKEINGYFVSQTWAEQPARVREIFDQQNVKADRMLKRKLSAWLEPPDEIYFVLLRNYGDRSLYISHLATRAESSRLVGKHVKESMQTLLIVSGLIVAVVALLVWFLFLRINRPITALWRWTEKLGPESLLQPVPDFTYSDLNRLALTIHESLNSLQQALLREHDFLRHASHELRTPISVIRNNIELIAKIQSHDPESRQSPMDTPLARIGRASMTMKHLTETLLWLGRDDEASMPISRINVASVLSEVIEENRYLLQDKAVTLQIKVSPYEMDLAATPARIVLTNLVRNAFQHTWKGEIEIRQQHGLIDLVNRNVESEAKAETHELGFGLGLQLVEQLCSKLGWEYHNQRGTYGHAVTLVLS